jgi:hypothetical protein
MGYRRFKIPETSEGPATVATLTTVIESDAKNVASEASVATAQPMLPGAGQRIGVAIVALVAGVSSAETAWDAECWLAFYNERAGILEFDGGLPRVQAEAQAFASTADEWLRRNPVQSQPGFCLSCGEPLHLHGPLLHSENGATSHTLLHPSCWSGWQSGRNAEAVRALAVFGIRETSRS